MKTSIEKRVSNRSLDGRPLSKEDEALLLAYIDNKDHLVGPNGHTIQVHYRKTIGSNSERIATYGVIKKAPSYLIAVCENKAEAMLDCGYVFEGIILYLTSIGVDTCWLGGTFKRDKLQVEVAHGQIIPVISPVGYGAEKKTFADKLTRRIAKSNSRKDFDHLFFSETFDQSISDQALREKLAYVRLAPSASNQQPWRVVMMSDGRAHFYIGRTPNYGKGLLAYDIQMVDMGIALCHYVMVSDEVVIHKEAPDLLVPNQDTSYVCSVVVKEVAYEDR